MKNAKNENLPEVSGIPPQKNFLTWSKGLFSWTKTARVRSLFISLLCLSFLSLITVLGYLRYVDIQVGALHQRNMRVYALLISIKIPLLWTVDR